MSQKGLKNFMDTPFKVMQPNKAYKTSMRSYNGIRFIAQGEFVGDNRSTAASFTIWNKPKDEKKDEGMKSEEMKEKGKKKAKKKGKKSKKKMSDKVAMADDKLSLIHI